MKKEREREEKKKPGENCNVPTRPLIFSPHYSTSRCTGKSHSELKKTREREKRERQVVTSSFVFLRLSSQPNDQHREENNDSTDDVTQESDD